MLDFEKELAVKIMEYVKDTYPYDFTSDELFGMCIDTYNDLLADNIEDIIKWFEEEKRDWEEEYLLEDIEEIIEEVKNVPIKHAEQLKEDLEETFKNLEKNSSKSA